MNSAPEAMPLARAHFHASLRRNRERLNARFAFARRTWTRMSVEAFSSALKFGYTPVAESICRDFSGSEAELDAILETLYDLLLELTGRELMGPKARVPLVQTLWSETLPTLAPLLIQAPRQVAGRLTNALLQLNLQKSADAAAWLSRLQAVGPQLKDTSTLDAVGRILAWQAGMAQHRSAALSALEQLETPMVQVLLSLPEDFRPGLWPLLKDQLEREPFTHPATIARMLMVPTSAQPPAITLVGLVGGFRGFGGPFLRPPKVSSSDGNLLVDDGSHHYYLFADCFGATFYRLPADFAAGAVSQTGGLQLQRTGRVSEGRFSREFPILANACSNASTSTTLAATLAHSFKVYLIAMVSHERATP